jgi:dTDP-4-dehydrorhamnose reductase
MPAKYLVWGEHGWIAGHFIDLLRRQNKDVHGTSVRMHDQAAVSRVLDEVKPTHVLNCAGKTGRPNIDWCEDHKIETMESNVIGTLILAYACWERGIHLTVLATGCKLFSPASTSNKF